MLESLRSILKALFQSTSKFLQRRVSFLCFDSKDALFTYGIVFWCSLCGGKKALHRFQLLNPGPSGALSSVSAFWVLSHPRRMSGTLIRPCGSSLIRVLVRFHSVSPQRQVRLSSAPSPGEGPPPQTRCAPYLLSWSLVSPSRLLPGQACCSVSPNAVPLTPETSPPSFLRLVPRPVFSL